MVGVRVKRSVAPVAAATRSAMAASCPATASSSPAPLNRASPSATARSGTTLSWRPLPTQA
jgi:hypothetical protein